MQKEIEIRRPTALARKRQIGLVVLAPISAFCNALVEIFFFVMGLPYIGLLLAIPLMPLAMLAGIGAAICGGLAISAQENQIEHDGETITVSQIKQPIWAPGRRHVARFGWADVEKVESVFDPPFFSAIIVLKSGEDIVPEPGANWTSIVEEAKRRGLFEDSLEADREETNAMMATMLTDAMAEAREELADQPEELAKVNANAAQMQKMLNLREAAKHAQAEGDVGAAKDLQKQERDEHIDLVARAGAEGGIVACLASWTIRGFLSAKR